MHGNFSATMGRLQVEDLVRIANSGESDYAPDAIEAARAELARRDVPEAELAEVAGQAADDLEREAGKADLSLSNVQWALFVLIGPMLVVMFAAAFILGARGYRRKSKEVLLAIPIGFVFWGMIAVLMDLFLF